MLFNLSSRHEVVLILLLYLTGKCESKAASCLTVP